MRDRVARIICLLSVGTVLGCSADLGPLNPIGQFTLVSIDSRPLPMPLGEVWRLRSTLTLSDGGGYMLTSVDSVVASGEVYPRHESGLWRDDQRTLILSRDQGGDIAAQAVDGAISFTLDSHVYSFKRVP